MRNQNWVLNGAQEFVEFNLFGYDEVYGFRHVGEVYILLVFNLDLTYNSSETEIDAYPAVRCHGYTPWRPSSHAIIIAAFYPMTKAVE